MKGKILKVLSFVVSVYLLVSFYSSNIFAETDSTLFPFNQDGAGSSGSGIFVAKCQDCVRLSFKSVHIRALMDVYGHLAGKTVRIDKGIEAHITIGTGLMKRAEAVRAIENALYEKGIVLVPTDLGPGYVKAILKNNNEK